MISLLLLPLLACFVGGTKENMDGAFKKCLMTYEVCEFHLYIDHTLTMMDNKDAVFPSDGKLFRFDVTNTSEAEPIDPSRVVVTDGFEPQQLIVTANGQMPGPAIEVYEGQQVIVHVTNRMTSSSTSIHWHGMHQRGTPWMDGVAYVTQCPIQPGQTFTFKFKAYPPGTFWYHSHIGAQLSMGLLGPLIVREKVPLPMEEFIMMLQDWNHDADADLIHLKMLKGHYVEREKKGTTKSLDGSHFSMFPFQSGLVNGRGRFFQPNGEHNGTPLTVYNVQSSKSYRFRVIGAGTLFPFRVSIDDHPLTVVASDGYELQPKIVESFVINPGERYDFIITTNQAVGNYWIRAETLEVLVEYHIALSILRYKGAPDQDPRTQRKNCKQNDICLVLNCPFTYYPEGSYTECVNYGELRATTNYNTPGSGGSNTQQEEEVEDVFFNFAFPGPPGNTPGSVNGRAFDVPAVSALTQPRQIRPVCGDDCGEQKICHCSYSMDLEHNKVYQMTFLNKGNGKGWGHPIHMHGHSFYVVKTGYPRYNQTTGEIIGGNRDIDCRGGPDPKQSFCNSATWANSSWGGNRVPGLDLELPPRKDTIIVPTGGYIVVRIRADNPGVWFMHCHIELHNLDGMAMMLNESFPNHPPAPRGFPKCNDFLYDQGEGSDDKPDDKPDDKGDGNGDGEGDNGKKDNDKHGDLTGEKDDDDDDDYDKELFWGVVGCLLALCIIQAVVLGCAVCYIKRSSKKGSGNPQQFDNAAFNSKL